MNSIYIYHTDSDTGLTMGAVGVQCLTQEQPEIKPPTLQLMDNLLYLLTHKPGLRSVIRQELKE